MVQSFLFFYKLYSLDLVPGCFSISGSEEEAGTHLMLTKETFKGTMPED
jgi:hypothetical protein